jgi:pilus assembly protein CpaB
MLTKLLLVLIVFGGGGFVWLRMQAQDRVAAPTTVEVRVANAPLKVGTFLSDANAPFTEIPVARLQSSHIKRGEDVALGAVIISPMAESALVERKSLLLPGQEGFLAAVLQPRMRAVSLAVDAVTSNAGHIFPGDRVDVLLTQHLDSEMVGDDPWRAWASETILSNVRVIAVDQNMHSDLTERATTDVASTITLEVGPRDAERLAVARNLGALSLTLRSLIVDDEPADVADEASETVPTWAGDISAAARASANRAVEPEPEEEVAPMRTLRGANQEVLSQ